MRKKIILFDWGGVILKQHPNHYSDRDAIVDTLKKFNNKLSYEEAFDAYLKTIRDKDWRIIAVLNDDASRYDWYQRINEKANLNTSYEEFVEEMINNYKKTDKYDKVVDFIYTLKDKAKLYLFSDLIFVCYPALAKQIDLKIFDQVFLSYEEGYIKTELEAFINVDNKLDRQGREVLFIDDYSANIENAKKVGWNTCQTTGDNVEQIIEVVNKFLEE